MQTIALLMSRVIAKATIADIARSVNVTASTVSRALNDHPGISASTKKLVSRAAKKLNYQPNKIASSLRLGKSQIIGVIIPSAEINFFGSVVHGIEKVANTHNYNVLLYQSSELYEYEKKGVQTFLRARVDGVLASIAKETINHLHYEEVRRRGIPLILFDRASETLNVPSVVIDDYKGAYNATKHLIEQGCKHIAHIGGPQHIAIFKERLRGYVDALNDHGMGISKSRIVIGKISATSGRTCMQKLLALQPEVDGLFAVEDFTALGAFQAIKAAGKTMPDDIALIGFANEAFGSYITPSLSTVDQQTIKMGEEAAKLFFRLSITNNFYAGTPKKIVLEPTLIYRASSVRNKSIYTN
jgi:LacI family transcriptional regulator